MRVFPVFSRVFLRIGLQILARTPHPSRVSGTPTSPSVRLGVIFLWGDGVVSSTWGEELAARVLRGVSFLSSGDVVERIGVFCSTPRPHLRLEENA